MKVLKKVFSLACMGLLLHGLSSCTNEEDVASVNSTMGLEVGADFLKLADNGTELAGELSIVSGSTDIQLIWNTDSICNLDATQTSISSQNGRYTLPIKWLKQSEDGTFGPEGTAYKAGVKIVAGEYSKYVPLIWAEKIDTTKVMESIHPVTRAASDVLPRVAQITLLPTTVNMNYANGGTMYVGLSEVPFAIFDVSEITSDTNIDMSEIPNYITASQMLNFKWNLNGAPSYGFAVHIIASSEGITQTGIIKYEASAPAKDYIEAGGIKWAKGDLQYVNGTYSIKNSQELSSSLDIYASDQWNYNKLLPVTITSTAQGDPCRQVAPAGTWRLPTKYEFDVLSQGSQVYGYYNNVSGIYFGVNAVPPVSSQSNTLFLPLVPSRGGYINSYWTSTFEATVNGKSDAYFFSVTENCGAAVIHHITTNNDHIRCVKN